MEPSQLNSKAFTTLAIKTPIFHAGEDLCDFITTNIDDQDFKDGDILVITSKIVSLAENRVVSKDSIDKTSLVKREADQYLGEIAYDCHLTIKHGLMIASAGIDESNSENDQFILFPNDPFLSAQKIYDELSSRMNSKHFGVLVTDSHTTPLRRGVTGVALAYWGFRGVNSQVDSPDLFNRKLQFTAINAADALSASATLVMGEGGDSCPLAILRNAPVEFIDQVDPSEIQIPLEDDLYFPILKDRL